MIFMKHYPKVSIIIPVYNVERYVRECFDGIVKQSFTDFEVVIVDDGSTDSSGDICDEYSRTDKRFMTIHKENEGSASARNVGMDNANGEWIVFCDSDDFVDVDYIANMIDVIDDDVDIVSCDYYVYRNGKDEYKSNVPDNLSPKFFACAALANKMHAGLWCKMFRKKLFDDNHIRFPKYSYYEDMCIFLTALHYTNRIIVLPKASYHYRYNDSSLTNDADFKKRLRLFDEFKENMEDLNRRFSLFLEKDIKNAFHVSVNYNKLKIVTRYPHEKLSLKNVTRWRRESYSVRDIKSLRTFVFYFVLKFDMFWLIRLKDSIRDVVYGKR